MSTNPSNDREIERARELIAMRCDRRLDGNDADELEALVCRNPDARRLYILAVSLHADLFLQTVLLLPAAAGSHERVGSDVSLSLHDLVIAPALREEDDDQPGSATPLPTPSYGDAVGDRGALRWYRRNVGRAAMLIISASLAIWLAVPKGRPPAGPSAGPERPAGAGDPSRRPAALAHLDLSLGPVWADDTVRVDGQFLTAGGLRLKSGIARLVMNSGVTVVLQGPAEVYLEDEGRLRLVNGRLAVKAPHTAPGFAVVTPVATVADIGTEFGVSVTGTDGSSPPRTDAVVFAGAIRLDRQRLAERDPGHLMRTGQACSATHDGVRAVPDPATVGAFVRDGDFERRKRAVEAVAAIVRNPDLLAYSFFDPDLDLRPTPEPPLAQLHWRAAAGPPAVALSGASVALGSATGRALSITGEHDAFLDLDTSPGGRLARRGYVGPDGCVHVSGKTLYLSWLGTAERSLPSQFGGLSLAVGDTPTFDEPLFIGQAFQNPNFSCSYWKATPRVKGTVATNHVDEPLDADSATPGVRAMPVDGQTHLWVAKVTFQAGGDRASIFLDPPADEPPRPNLSLAHLDLRFNRIRLASGPGCAWRFGRLLMGESYDAVVPKQGG